MFTVYHLKVYFQFRLGFVSVYKKIVFYKHKMKNNLLERKILMKNLFAFFMLIALVSFLGFAVENLWTAATKGFMDNKNMTLPFLLGYGLAVAAMYLLFGLPRKMHLGPIKLDFESEAVSIIFYFIMIMLCICVGEIILGFAVEKICGIEWWNYTALPLHITKYTSIPTSAGFSLIIVHFMDNIFVPLFEFLQTWHVAALGAVAVPLMLLMTVDFFRSGYLMYKNKSLLRVWRRETTKNRIYRALHK